MNVVNVDSKNVTSQLGWPVDDEKLPNNKNVSLQINSAILDMRVMLLLGVIRFVTNFT